MAVVAIVFFFGPGVAYLGGARAKEIENRRLTSFPSISQGWSALPQLGRWAIDHLPGRQQAVDANDAVTRHVFGEYPNYGTTGTGPVQYPYVLSGKDGWLYFGDDIANKCNPLLGIGQTMARMQRLANVVTKSGRRFLLVVAPDKSTSYPQALPANYPGKACSTAWSQKFWTTLRATPGLNLVDHPRTARGSTAAHRPADVAPARFPFQPARRVDLRADARRLPRLAARPGHHG